MLKVKSKQELLDISNKNREVLKVIGDLSNVLSHDEKEKLDNLNKRFDDWNERLSDDRYRVAIIGTEKAGKSTFANSLLRKDFLPEDESRCTFTTTTIESSQTEDTAEIEFFTKNEFVQKFNSLCEEVGFECSYDSVRLSDLDKFCTNTSDVISRSNAVDDIRAIIEVKEEISRYLSGERKTFTGESIKNDVKSYITDKIKARSVKNITIRSTQFKNQEDLIIYDVPGFDSPTKLHLEQAKWYMSNADIVIMLISIADRISFVKAQADFINDTKDRYGNKLSNKLIVVASKFDKHIVDDKKSSDDKIEKSYKILEDELKRYGLYNEKNTFKASSLGFLEKEKIVSTQYASSSLEKHNYFDGIQNIEARLQEFLNGEALEILNESFEIDQSLAHTFMLEFKREHNPHRDEKKKRADEIALIDKKWDEIKAKLKTQLTDYQKNVKELSFEFDDVISIQVKEHWIDNLKEQLPNEVKKAEAEIVGGRSLVAQATKINDKVRENIYKKSLDKIVNISTEIITHENQNKEEYIFDNVAKIVFDTKNLTDEEKNELNELLEFIKKDFTYEAKSYRPLILRFLNNVFEILILNRITNDENDTRIERFKILRADMEALLNYDNNFKDENSFYEQDLIKRLLIQDTDYHVKDENIVSLLKGAKVATLNEEVIKEISNDLDALGDIFNNILLKAINIESPFKASINDQIQAILNDVNENSESKLKTFVIHNIESIARDDYNRLEVDEKVSVQISSVINLIDKF